MRISCNEDIKFLEEQSLWFFHKKTIKRKKKGTKVEKDKK
jgi:hypothetical protein